MNYGQEESIHMTVLLACHYSGALHYGKTIRVLIEY